MQCCQVVFLCLKYSVCFPVFKVYSMLVAGCTPVLYLSKIIIMLLVVSSLVCGGQTGGWRAAADWSLQSVIKRDDV